MNARFALTGGPGAGKTTVLEALEARGCHCAPDVARAIIKRRLEAGLSPRPDPVEFAQRIFAGDVANYRAAPMTGVSYFDRSVIDSLGMLKQCEGVTEQELELALQQYPYNNVAFVFPPWEDIYETDSERDQTFADAVRVFASVKSWYARCGYELREVPFGTVEERVAFVQRCVAVATSQ